MGTTKQAMGVVTALITVAGGCGGPTTQGVDTSRYDMTLDMKSFMGHVLEPAADVVWDSAGVIVTLEGETSLAPSDDAGWAAVEAAGAMIVEAGNALQLPERNRDADWAEFAAAMSTVGLQVMAAAEAQSEEAVFQSGATLYAVCVACHQVHAPGL